MGELVEQTFPHPIGEVGRTYRYAYRHGAWTGLTSQLGSGPVQGLIPDLPSVPGITYHADGGVRAIRYGNGRITTIEVNAAYLPQRISVAGGRRVEAFDAPFRFPESGRVRAEARRYRSSSGASCRATASAASRWPSSLG